jgi:hypothetical protein
MTKKDYIKVDTLLCDEYYRVLTTVPAKAIKWKVTRLIKKSRSLKK